MPTGTLSTTSLPLAPAQSLPMPLPPRLRLEVLLVAVVDQRVEAGDRLDHDVAALAAVAAVRAAELDEFLAPERHAAVAARAGRDIDLGFIEEFHGCQGISHREPTSPKANLSRNDANISIQTLGLAEWPLIAFRKDCDQPAARASEP